MNSELEELYQQVLLDHSRRPRNYGELDDATHVHGDNPTCGDEIHLHVHFGPDGRVDEVKFTGQGCAISQASASLMTLKLKGKSGAEARALADKFHHLIIDGEAPSEAGLGDLQVFAGVRKFPQRAKCAMLAWRAFEQAQAESAGTADAPTVTTEDPDAPAVS